MALIALCLLSACARSTPSAKVELPEIPAELQSCPKLQSVTGRTGGATEIGDNRIKVLWAQDRTAAVQCHRKHEALVIYYNDLRRSIAPE